MIPYSSLHHCKGPQSDVNCAKQEFYRLHFIVFTFETLPVSSECTRKICWSFLLATDARMICFYQYVLCLRLFTQARLRDIIHNGSWHCQVQGVWTQVAFNFFSLQVLSQRLKTFGQHHIDRL